ncbi:TetR/AcrR family transcriptional regulator [Streptomyces sp. GMY01]|uniref:TetR/AcrR family transcriptional regulator n=1 Tax=Streptomyces sp. GMY02 TaxID=1333528 RepID=UPI00146D3AFD|nr:TetR/AcrR family transcriptional regulator [Streptomyces sp. GMY02]NMO35506.1 TetR/AcrR family transcriptional regulator [Streptomyces sp. GMY02]
MPAARDSLLDAAYMALARLPWPAVRMVDVAAAAGVSRQTLYNEFGSKDGLARALVRREAAGFLAGIDRALAPPPADPYERLTAAAEWTASAAQGNALVKALLTGCWSDRLPPPPRTLAPAAAPMPPYDPPYDPLFDPPLAPAAAPAPVPPFAPPPLRAVPVQRRADGPVLSPGGLLAAVRDRAVAAVSAPGAAGAVPADVCELVFRLALSCVAAPPDEGGIADLVRGALHHRRTA